ncbi:MAG: patatin-like phospholipase family protein [Atribacterota bacterium]
MEEKFGLVLESGGAKGSYEIGACKALEEIGVRITAVTGTSVGALNGVMVAQHEIDKAYQMWYDMRPSKVMKIDEKRLNQLSRLEIKPGDMRYYIKMLGEIITEGGIDVTPLKRLIKEYVNEDKLRKSDINFGMVTVSFTDRKALELFVEDIPRGQVADYLFASANFPLFRSAKIGDKIFMDGGIYDNLPIGMLLKKGYKSFITIRVGGMGRKRKVNLEDCHVINIEAREPLAGPLNFSKEKARESLKLGYFDAYRVMKNLSGQFYYIKLEHEENYFLDYFSHLDADIIAKVAQTLNLKEDIPHQRLLFERVLPKLVELLKLPEDCSYQDIAIALAEKIAIEVGVERFRIYSFTELIDCIIGMYGKHKMKTYTEEKSLISHFGFLSLFTGGNVLKKLVQDLLDEKLIKLLKDEQESQDK